MATDIKLETKQVSHVSYRLLSGAKACVVAAMTRVDEECWDDAHEQIELAIVDLVSARDKVKAAWDKHGVRD